MGLIRAAVSAAGSVLADQWKEYFYCDALSTEVLAARASKRSRGGNRGSGDRGGRGSGGGGRSVSFVFVDEHGLAGLDLDLIGALVERYFILHLSLSSLISRMERNRSSLSGLPSESATMAMIMAASFGSVS